MDFKLKSKFQPTGDQPQAIDKLVRGLKSGYKHQTLLGVTGSGKSVTGDTMVVIKKGQKVINRSIGGFIDSLFLKFKDKKKIIKNSEVLLTVDLPKDFQFSTFSFNPLTKKQSWKPIIQLVRHRSPKNLYNVQTSCGREVAVTGDHNFYILRSGVIQLVSTHNIKKGDYLPLPLGLNCSKFLQKINFLDYLPSDIRLFIFLSNFSKVWNSNKEKIRQILNPAKIHNILFKNERIPLDIYKKLVKIVPQLSNGAKIGVYGRDYQMPLAINLSNGFLRLFGYYIAEGHAADDYLIISSGDKEIIEDFTKIFNKLKIYFRLRPQSYDYQISSKFWREFFASLCGANSKEKHLPVFWPQLSKEQLANLLSAYFSGDGGVEENTVSCTTASKILASDIVWALTYFGITARIRKRLMKIPGKNKKGEYWLVSITGQKFLSIFYKDIKFIVNAKQDKLFKIIHKPYNTNVDVIPIDGQWLKAVRLSLKLSQKELVKISSRTRSLISLIESNQRKPSREVFKSITEILLKKSRQLKNQKFINDILDKKKLLNLYWTPIKNIEKIKSDGYVYDFAVKDNETFLAGFGGIFVHNTFTMANVVRAVQKPTLVISHNKTLAAQLASEFKEFFPENAVHYFVSYYDYYLPESYKPQSDTYIEKETEVNEEIDRLRHASTNALLTRKDVLIVASVSCIYGLGSPSDYQNMRISLTVGQKIKRDKLLRQLTDLQYQRNDYDFYRGNFRVKGDVLDIFPIEEKNEVVRVEFDGDVIEKITKVDSGLWLDSKKLHQQPTTNNQPPTTFEIFPAKHFVTPEERLKQSIENIQEEMKEQVKKFKKEGRLIEAQRIEERTKYDLEMIQQTGYCNGIENYSRYLTNRNPGEPPATLLEYFPDDFLLFIDESHMTIPQLNAMHNGDRARKQTLVDFGFRLPSALDNRPLKFAEFEENTNQAIYVSATPGPYEYRMSKVECRKIKVGALEKDVVDYEDLRAKIEERSSAVAQQVIRPTGLLEPQVFVRKTQNQIADLIKEINQTVKNGQRVLVTTLTKRLAEDLTEHLQEQNIKVQYLHSEVHTLDRLEIIRDLRLGKYDVLVGINLLREGLDLPEVSLVAILDADKEGFLRSETSLIQTMGRASRHLEGRVIMYADNLTGSMKRAMAEVNRRRQIQEDYNRRHNITPASIIKEVREENVRLETQNSKLKTQNLRNIPKDEFKHIMEDLENQMKLAADDLQFEKAAELRDQLKLIKKEKL